MEELARWLAACEFPTPWASAAVAAIVLLALLFSLRVRRKALTIDLKYWRQAVAFKSLRVQVYFGLTIPVVLLLALAVVNPQITLRPSLSIYGKPVMAIVDVSGSMESKPKRYVGGVENTDMRTSYEKATAIYFDLIGRRPDVNFGLLLYSTENYIVRYFSYKNELLSDTLENREEIDYISTGTRTADALAVARKFMTKNFTGKDKAVVLISDLEADLEAMVQTAEEMERLLWSGIRIYGIVIPNERNQNTDWSASLAGIEQLKLVAMNDKAGIDAICDEISKMSPSPLRQEETVVKTSLVPYLVAPALALVLVSLFLSETRLRKIP